VYSDTAITKYTEKNNCLAVTTYMQNAKVNILPCLLLYNCSCKSELLAVSSSGLVRKLLSCI